MRSNPEIVVTCNQCMGNDQVIELPPAPENDFVTKQLEILGWVVKDKTDICPECVKKGK